MDSIPWVRCASGNVFIVYCQIESLLWQHSSCDDDVTNDDADAREGLRRSQCYEPVRRPWPRTPGTFLMPGAAAGEAQIIRGDKLEAGCMLDSC